MAEELTVNDFFQQWIRRGIPWKSNVEITEVYTHNLEVYFFECLNSENKIYLGNRTFEKGKKKLYKVNKSELEEKFGFYKDIDPTGIKGVDLKLAFAKKVGLEQQYNNNYLANGVFTYKLKNNGIEVVFKKQGETYTSFYNADKKKFE